MQQMQPHLDLQAFKAMEEHPLVIASGEIKKCHYKVQAEAEALR
jgi:hypothetical protein